MLEDWNSVSGRFSGAILIPDSPIPPDISRTNNGRTDTRFAVYRNNVTVGLIGAMEANFPAIRRLVGDEFFAAMAKVFVQNNPPQSRLMAEYGAGFPAFLDTFEPLTDYTFMADVARLERLWLDSYHEADAPSLDGTALAALAPDALFGTRFVAHPATRLFTSPYAAVSIMSANRAAGEVPVIDPAISECGLITRPLLEVDVRHIPEPTHLFLSALIQGKSLGEATESAFVCESNFDLAVNIQGMLQSGVFTSMHDN